MFLNLIPPNNFVYANELPPITHKKAKDDSLDPELKMVSGEEYKSNVGKPTGPGQRYTIESSNTGLNFDDYMNDVNWMVKVQGYQFKKPLKQVERGWMPLLRPLHDGSGGRLFFNDLTYWTLQFNGDDAYVKARAKRFPTIIKENKSTKEFNKYYIRDLAMWTGSLISIERLNQFDTGLGHELAAAIVETTSYPDATITVPPTAKVGDTIDIGFAGKEYYPAKTYGTEENIRYDLKVNGKSIASGTRKAKSIDYTKAYTFATEGSYKIELVVTDQVNRMFTTSRTVDVGNTLPPPPDAEYPNRPPIAEISTLPFYYWVETVDISTISYDDDGDIVSEEWSVDGQPISGNTWKSSRVTEKTSHTAYFRNEDAMGASAEAFASFDILPTTPTAKTTNTGSFKQNRAITFDAKASDLVSPVHVAPIDYSRTTWKFIPKSEGLTNADIKIRTSSDPSKRHVLFKKAGKYELQMTVTNNYDETSEVLIEEIEIRPDEKPFAGFTVDKSVYLRDVNANKQTTVTLTDNSASVDGDSIAQRIWYVEFDATTMDYLDLQMEISKLSLVLMKER